MNYVAQFNQSTDAIYPYASGNGVSGSCNYPLVNSLKLGQAVKLSGPPLIVTPTQNEAAMMQAVSVAPVVVYFNAADLDFMFYSGGIYAPNPSACGSVTNHASKFSYCHLSINLSCQTVLSH